EGGARLVGELGSPVGVKSDKPFHSKGEDFLHNFIGMTGIPIDLHPVFPEDAQTVLLTESAKYDPDIVQKIERHLRSGKSVVITSGLLEALQDRGLGNVVELEVTGRKALVDEFLVDGGIYRSSEKIIIPQIDYLTNDSWEL